jgi:nucleoside-diphosphate-sugar epimerase
MRVLLLGGGGFIGRHLRPLLRGRGHDVSSVGFPATDLLDSANLYAAFAQSNPECVVHLAAVVGREAGEHNPELTVRTNVTLTAKVAQLCAAYDCKLLYVSSSEVYGPKGRAYGPVPEWAVKRPINLYGWSKLWGEQVAGHYLPDVSIARLAMPYGPWHPPGQGRAAITNFLWQALHGLTLTVHRNTERSWLWVGDAAEALARLVEHERPLVVNIGRHDPRSMESVAELAVNLSHPGPAPRLRFVDPPAGVTEIKRLDCARARRELGWEPRVELEDGMLCTLAWLRTLAPPVSQVSA